MIKAFLRVSLLLVLSLMLVYAPEIFSSVSPPYTFTSPDRILLRIALHADKDTLNVLHTAIQTYQKQYPHVHLRITHISENLLLNSPYPDVVCFPAELADRLPSSFSQVLSSFPISDDVPLCAVCSSSTQIQAAAELTAYIYEALSAQSGSPEI